MCTLILVTPLTLKHSFHCNTVDRYLSMPTVHFDVNMSRPPLYSRSGDISPTAGEEAKMAIGASISPRGCGQDGEKDGESYSPAASLLEKAQQFSLFAVQHVEEARRTLLRTADSQTLINDDNTNPFGGKNGVEIAAAFEQLAAAYDKLSSLKWDAARREFEDSHRVQTELDAKYSKGPIGSNKNAKVERRVTALTATESGEPIMESRGVKEDPWQDDEMNPHDWISNAFLKGAMSSEEEDEDGDCFPVNGHLASLNATAEPFPAASMSAKSASTPPGFKSESALQKAESNEAEDEQVVDGSDQTKPTMQSLTSISSEISSLHTSSQPCTDDDYDDDEDDEDSNSEYSDMSSLSDELPSMDNFDYLYKGGYAMQVSGGKETKGVVPKSVRRVLVASTVKKIEEGAFQGCNVLESITIPSSVEAIEDNAFRKCSKLKRVVFLTRAPKSRRRKQLWDQKRDEKKEEKQFRRSSSAPSSITEPRSSRLHSIGEWAFFNCSSLAAVTLPHGLESIGSRAFQRCSSMSITEMPKTLTSVGENAFVGCPRETKAALERWEKEY